MSAKKKTTVTSAIKKVAKTATKSAKKVASKKNTKTTAKKSTKKTTHSKKCLCKKPCKPSEAFWVNNGPVVDSVAGLKIALQDMSNEQYAYHTKREGNDFAKWIRDCVCDCNCADRLAKARSRVGAVRALTCGCKAK